jgi:hypothetical protein
MNAITDVHKVIKGPPSTYAVAGTGEGSAKGL